MKIKPMTLFTKIFLSFSITMFGSLVCLLVTFILLFSNPLADATSRHVSQHVEGVRTAVLSMGGSEKEAYLQKLSSLGIRYSSADSQPPGNEPDRPFQFRVLRGVSTKIGLQGSDIRFSFDYLNSDTNVVWVKVVNDAINVWVGYPLVSSNEPLQKMLLIQLAIITVLSLITGYGVARSIRTPMSRLVSSANELSLGRIPRFLPEKGPREIGLMAQSFNRMASNIQRDNESMRLMHAGISHDLRTPLTRIRLLAEIVSQFIDASLHQKLSQEVELMDEILGQFLVISESGSDEVVEPVDLNYMIGNVVGRYEDSGKTIEMDFDDIPDLNLKPVSVQRLIINLLDNACKYGGDTITLQTEGFSEAVVFRVYDSGSEWVDSDTDKTGRRFQGGRGNRTFSSGSGLGLSIVEKIAEWNNAKLDIFKRSDGGFQVEVEFPVTQ